MGKVILLKLTDFFLGSYERRLRLFLFAILFLFLSILMIIRVFWKPIEYFIMLILALTLYKVVSKFISDKIEDKLDAISDLMDMKKYNKALKKLDKVMEEDLPLVKGDKKDSVYYKCINNKAGCILNIGCDKGGTEYMRKATKLYEKVLELAYKENKNVVHVMLNLGSAYYYLGFYENNKEILKIAVRVFENALEKAENKEEKLNIIIRIRLAYCYQVLADYCNREEYLKKSLEELDFAYDKIFEGKYGYDEASIDISRASAMRKLNEISFQENYKTKAIENLNASVIYLKSIYNKHYKKYFPKQYIGQRYYMASAYFEMFKVTNLQEYVIGFKEFSKEIRECCTTKDNAYFIKKINEMSDELDQTKEEKLC